MTASTRSLPTDVHGYGALGSRPAAGVAGREYFDTGAGTLYRDNGTSWDALSFAPSPITTYLDLTDQGGDPSSPAAGTHRLYAKSGGLYVKDSAGSVVGALGSGGGGSGTSIPKVIQLKQSTTTATSVTLDQAPVSGKSLILLSNATTGQITAVTCTNVTWTQIKTLTSAGSSFYAVWVGIVGASAGTVISWTKPGSFATIMVIETDDVLTPTLGLSASGSQAVAAFLGIAAVTAGHLVVLAGGTDNTTVTSSARMTLPSAGIDAGVNWMTVGYGNGGRVAATGGVASNGGGLILAEVT